MKPETQYQQRKNALIALGLSFAFLIAFGLWLQAPVLGTQVLAIMLLIAGFVWAIGKIVVFAVERVVGR